MPPLDHPPPGLSLHPGARPSFGTASTALVRASARLADTRLWWRVRLTGVSPRDAGLTRHGGGTVVRQRADIIPMPWGPPRATAVEPIPELQSYVGDTCRCAALRTGCVSYSLLLAAGGTVLTGIPHVSLGRSRGVAPCYQAPESGWGLRPTGPSPPS